jgi:hypothetical protein
MNTLAFAGVPGAAELLLIIIILLTYIFWIWSIIDCATKEPSEGNDKVIWILVIVLLHWLGSLIYCIARRPKRIQQFGK